MRRATTLRGWSKSERTNITEPSEVRKAPSKKDTKRWCRGKIGVEHTPGWIFRSSNFGGRQVYRRGCTTCGRLEWSGECDGTVWRPVPGSCTRGCGDVFLHHVGCAQRSEQVFRCICGNHKEQA